MDKIKAFLTQKLNKYSFKDVNVIRAIKLTLCGAMLISIMLQAFGCFFAPMVAYAAEDDSIVGTWYFNTSLTSTKDFGISGVLYFDFYFIKNSDQYDLIGLYTTPDNSLIYRLSNGSSYFAMNKGVWDEAYRTIYVTDDSMTPDSGKAWLKANATKVVEEVYDFTGETRVFNDELTLFNTSQATWTEAFSFNFEVLGVGTADYLILQRTSQNWYTMSYSFDFDGSGGLTMIYRDSPPIVNGESEWLGGKVNRKVITFLSNPEDPEFQQWLLDNTTLFDDVNAAYQLGQQSGYNNGYEEGFANSLIGDSLSGPINALSQITLIEIQGTAITLGGVVMTAIALCLVLAFLKLYAGG